jgi:aspartate kinase
MSGTTNTLVEIADYLKKGNREAANSVINKLRAKYMTHTKELHAAEEWVIKTSDFLEDEYMYLHSFSGTEFTATTEKTILAQGEMMSTNMVTNYLKEIGIKVMLIPALDYMMTDKNGEPDLAYIENNLKAILNENPNYDIYITQGFICRDAEGRIDNLQRGGSDYTASLIGAALGADEIQIWTDIDGMHNNDPRIVEGTTPVRQLHFDEAAELAYFGAKILHPTCVQPARFAGVPVRLLNTMDPSAPGTLINNEMQHNNIKAIAAKDNITAIKIVSSRMLLATGFLRKVFEIFETYKTSIDLVTTSEVGVSLSIDNNSRIYPIVEELKKYGTVEVDEDMCIICVVGDLDWNNVGFESKVTAALENIPVRMISYGGSDHNISFLIRGCDKQAALQALSKKLF